MIRDELQELVDRQAEDWGLWYPTDDIAVAYIQQELRRLHAAIEARDSRWILCILKCRNVLAYDVTIDEHMEALHMAEDVLSRANVEFND